jgi:hypothetical protein
MPSVGERVRWTLPAKRGLTRTLLFLYTMTTPTNAAWDTLPAASPRWITFVRASSSLARGHLGRVLHLLQLRGGGSCVRAVDATGRARRIAQLRYPFSRWTAAPDEQKGPGEDRDLEQPRREVGEE